MLIKNKKGE